MIERQETQLDTDIRQRYEMDPSGELTVKCRNDKRMLYGTPRHEHAFIWTEREDRHNLVMRHEVVRRADDREYGCFYAMPTLDAAIMFARAVTPQPTKG